MHGNESRLNQWKPPQLTEKELLDSGSEPWNPKAETSKASELGSTSSTSLTTSFGSGSDPWSNNISQSSSGWPAFDPQVCNVFTLPVALSFTAHIF